MITENTEYEVGDVVNMNNSSFWGIVRAVHEAPNGEPQYEVEFGKGGAYAGCYYPDELTPNYANTHLTTEEW